jgi:hypothetical protein
MQKHRQETLYPSYTLNSRRSCHCVRSCRAGREAKAVSSGSVNFTNNKSNPSHLCPESPFHNSKSKLVLITSILSSTRPLQPISTTCSQTQSTQPLSSPSTRLSRSHPSSVSFRPPNLEIIRTPHVRERIGLCLCVRRFGAAHPISMSHLKKTEGRGWDRRERDL